MANVNMQLGAELREFRQSKDMTIESFWRPIGVTKSAGSRYETSDRGLPDPVLNLLFSVYGYRPGVKDSKGLKRVGVTASEVDLLEFLRENPDVLQMVERLKRAGEFTS